eukprot:Nk52_evm26s2506 gene=Nk52_evmTU26s2506
MQQRHSLQHHTRSVRGVSFSPVYAHLLASGGYDGLLNLYNARSSQLLRSVPMNSSSGDSGEQMAAQFGDNNMQYSVAWNHVRNINAVRFTCSGDRVAVCGCSRLLQVVDVESGGVVCAYKGATFNGPDRTALGAVPFKVDNIEAVGGRVAMGEEEQRGGREGYQGGRQRRRRVEDEEEGRELSIEEERMRWLQYHRSMLPEDADFVNGEGATQSGTAHEQGSPMEGREEQSSETRPWRRRRWAEEDMEAQVENISLGDALVLNTNPQVDDSTSGQNESESLPTGRFFSPLAARTSMTTGTSTDQPSRRARQDNAETSEVAGSLPSGPADPSAAREDGLLVCADCNGRGLNFFDMRVGRGPIRTMPNVHGGILRDVCSFHPSWVQLSLTDGMEPIARPNIPTVVTASEDGTCKILRIDGLVVQSFDINSSVFSVTVTPEMKHPMPLHLATDIEQRRAASQVSQPVRSFAGQDHITAAYDASRFESAICFGGKKLGIISKARGCIEETFGEHESYPVWKARYTSNGKRLYVADDQGVLRRYLRQTGPEGSRHVGDGIVYSHSDDIEDMAISVNDEYIATASQDRTVGLLKIGSPSHGCSDYGELC